MKRWALVALVSVLLNGGCSARDVWWNVFGGAYTDGGHTPEDRRAHFDKQYDAWESSKHYYDPTAER